MLLHTFTHIPGHGFIILTPCTVLPRTLLEVERESFLCYYKPLMSGQRHVLSISQKSLRSFSSSRAKVTVSCQHLPKSESVVDTTQKYYEEQRLEGFSVMIEPGNVTGRAEDRIDPLFQL